MLTDLPIEVIRCIANNLNSTDTLKLSTCHSIFSGSLNVEKIHTNITEEADLDSFLLWLKKNPGIVTKHISVEDTMGLIAGSGLVDCLAHSYGTTLPELTLDTLFQPAEILSKMPGVQRATFRGGMYDSRSSLSANTALKELTLCDGLDASIDAEIVGLSGITDAVNMRKLTLLEQELPMCLCALPKLKSLTHLHITGTKYCQRIVHNIKSTCQLPALKYLVLDSSSFLLEDAEVRLALENLEVLDVSRRHILAPAGTHDESMHEPSSEFVQWLRGMPYLTTFGAADLVLDHTVGSDSIKKLTMSGRSFIYSLAAGMTFENFPNLQELVIHAATSLSLDEYEVIGACDLFCEMDDLEVTLWRHSDDAQPIWQENESLTTWFRIASECPAVVFMVK
jgi:hypothetical protein